MLFICELLVLKPELFVHELCICQLLGEFLLVQNCSFVLVALYVLLLRFRTL